ncbi:glycosyltransferase [Paenibacillus crassostreae]|uniref:Methyltransferase domain-containing protein n=1 Tax=Paenibacillus crassostreae TaxID=1763538 RepID=A0A162KWE9_9BACL|nr:methyltransferase domain-containing protein [Paenibacillus crassostreae]AOZ93301.1 hypothetical protein LPB68_14495 [Paenibacillus crassostreae]OAB75053.1 hypothetical protein PNBC_09440 [Paenibacillus crassostreae]
MLNNMILNKPKIYIFCFGFKRERDIEAIKKEARTYYQFYKSISQSLEFKFISLENELLDNEEIYDADNDVYYWSYNFNELIQQQSPTIAHVFVDSLDGYFLFEKNYSSKSIITFNTVTGIDAFREFDEGYLEHLRHAIDVGNLYLFVESKVVKDEFLKMGLQTYLMYPRIKALRNRPEMIENKPFTIGFASAPLSKKDWEGRGIQLLVSLAAQLKHYKFKIAWRNEGYDDFIALLNENNLTNFEVYNGYLDMNDFYKGVDVMLAPYTTQKNNHSCPLSILESILLGIPVAVTNVVGLQDVVEQYNFGVVSKCEVGELAEKVGILEKNYDFYKKNAEDLGSELFDINKLDNNNYLKIYDEVIYQVAAPTLNEWRSQLNANNKYLVMNQDGMAEYYNDSFIANNYDESRFSEFPMRTYDLLERNALNILTEKHSPKGIGMNNILDIASGEGRIMRSLLEYGQITAVENSAFMISVSVRKLSDINKVTYVKNDFFSFITDEKYDIISVFRFIRHFNYLDRIILYQKIYKLLNDDGIIIADFPNKQAETQLRSVYQWGSFNVYDVFWNEFEIINELNDNGFQILDSISVGEYLNKGIMNNDELPLSRIVCFGKR